MKLKVVASNGRIYTATMADETVPSRKALIDEAIDAGAKLVMTLNGVEVEFMPDQVRLLTFEWGG